MKGFAVLLAGAALAVAGCSAQASPTSGDIEAQAQIATAHMGADRGDAPLVELALTPTMQPDFFPRLSAPRQYEVASMFGHAAMRQQHWQAAHQAFILATAVPGASNEDWAERLVTAFMANDAPDTLLALRHRIDHDLILPLSSLPGEDIERIDQLLGQTADPAAARLVLGRQLAAEHWSSPYAFDDISVVWLHYVDALLASGDTDGARSAARRITDPMVLIAMQADRRYDALLATDPDRFNPQAAAARYLEKAQDGMRAHPRMLSDRVAVARALTILGRDADALAILDEALQAFAQGGPADAPFDDPDMRSAILNWRNGALISVGRGDEAIGSRLSDSCMCGGPSGAVALIRAYVEVGQPKAALQWLDKLPPGGLSEQAMMDVGEYTACAASQANKAERADVAIRFLREHEGWEPEALVRGLVCAGRMDDAASTLKSQLQNPRYRLSALASLQDIAPDHAPYAPIASSQARWAALKARPDVQAEVGKVGRIRTYPLNAFISVS